MLSPQRQHSILHTIWVLTSAKGKSPHLAARERFLMLLGATLSHEAEDVPTEWLRCVHRGNVEELFAKYCDPLKLD